jgi:hypothetical protein
MPPSAARRSKSTSRRRPSVRRPEVHLTSRRSTRPSPDRNRRRSRSRTPLRLSTRPSTSSLATEPTGPPPPTSTPSSDRAKKALPAGIVRAREIPGNNYEYAVTVDEVEYKIVSAFYCTLCHAQLHSPAIESHVSSRRHKGKITADADDDWETDSHLSSTMPLAGANTQPLSQFQSAGYMAPLPPALPVAPQPAPQFHQPTLPPQPVMTQQATAPQTYPAAAPMLPPPTAAPMMMPPIQPPAPPAPTFPPCPVETFRWTDEDINNLFSSATFRARLHEFVVNLSGSRSHSVLDRIPPPPAPRR